MSEASTQDEETKKASGGRLGSMFGPCFSPAVGVGRHEPAAASTQDEETKKASGGRLGSMFGPCFSPAVGVGRHEPAAAAVFMTGTKVTAVRLSLCHSLSLCLSARQVASFAKPCRPNGREWGVEICTRPRGRCGPEVSRGTGSLGCRTGAWRVREKRHFPRRLNMGKRLDGIVGNVKMWPTWVQSRDDSSATVGQIDMGSTRVGRELIGLANDLRIGGWCAPRALPRVLSFKNRVFRSFFRIAVGTRRL